MVLSPQVRGDSLVGFVSDSGGRDEGLHNFSRSLAQVDSVTYRRFDNRKSFGAVVGPALAAVWVAILVKF